MGRWAALLPLLVLAATSMCLAQVGPVRLQVSTNTGTVAAGDSIQASATREFVRNTGPGDPFTPVWSTLSPAVATVDSTGLVTTHSQGTTLIVAVNGPFRGSASVSATPPVLRSVAVLPQVPSIANGFTQQFQALGTFSDGSTFDMTSTVTWSSQFGAVATIATTPAANPGLATSAGAGSTLITATDPVTTIFGSTTLSVTRATLQAVTVTRDPPADLPIGATEQFTATGTFSDGSTVDLSNTATWSTTPGGVATITTTGLATGTGVGSTVVNATVNAISDTLPPTLNVTAATLTSIVVTPANITLPLGTTQQYSALGLYSDGSSFDLTATATWQSSTAAATVNSTGFVTAAAVGPTNISASQNGITGMTGLTVSGATLLSIDITPLNPTISAGLTVQFTATGHYSDSSTANLTNNVTWQSSDNTVAVIAASGLATTFKAGAVTISAVYQGQFASTTLTVTPPALTKITVLPAGATIPFNGTLQYTAIGIFSNGTKQDITTQVTWSNNNNRVSLDANGLATGTKKGKTMIRAKLNGITGQAKAVVQ